MGFIRKHGRQWCVHNEATGKVIVAKGKRRCYSGRGAEAKARRKWYELDCKYTGRHCAGLDGLDDQFCVRLPAEAVSTSGHATYRLTKAELGKVLRAWGKAGWKAVRKDRAPSTSSAFHPTAAPRKRMAVPLRKALPKKCGRALYHGVGRDAPGAAALRRRCRRVVEYDPFHPDPKVRRKPKGRFDEIFSVYVLNVVPKTQGRHVLREIHRLLAPGGHATISVRRDTC